MNNNIFYLFKGEQRTATNGQFNVNTGEFEYTTEAGKYCITSWLTNLRPYNRNGIPVFSMFAPEIVSVKQVRVFMYDKDIKYLGYDTIQTDNLEYFIYSDESIHKKVEYIKCDFILDISETELSQMTSTEINDMLMHVWIYSGFKLQEPHYKKLENKYKKETGQVFFRSSLEGSVKIFGTDCDFIKSRSLETKYLFMVTNSEGLVLALNSFAKTDCKLDDTRHSIELKLSSIDRYSKLMDKYDNTYDLIKLSPAITPLTLTKRLLYQFYIQGANSVSCYANGTYWEQDVNEIIDDEYALKSKYHFTENLTKQEIIVEQEQSDYFAGTYIRNESYNGYEWVHVANKNLVLRLEPLTDSQKAGYNTPAWPFGNILNAATGVHPVDNHGESKDSLYWIRLINKRVFGSAGSPNLKSKSVYCTSYSTKKFNGIFSSGINANYELKKEIDNTNAFNLRDCLINYTIWGRILADVDTVVEPSTGQTKTLYDLPKDDFISERVNYRKCIGLKGLHIKQAGYTVKHPTKYGRNDYGEYFSNNFVNITTKTEHMPVPISRSTWANTSIWAIIPDSWEPLDVQFRTQFVLKDAFSLSNVIKALLHKIDPLVKFEATSEYSAFFYDENIQIIPDDLHRARYIPYITPKSNVLKGNYDQAAQKAEITFEQVMNMLRDCFRCYWYIDDNNRLRIEHISYFMNGLSYSNPNLQFDLTNKYDKFNKKIILYAQEATSYNKDDLNSRYEFNWMDDSTDTFDDIEIDVKSVYTQSDKTEEINSEVFSTDIDLMLYAPDKFSNDGFVLIMADKNTGKVPIVSVSGLRDDEYIYTYSATPQNYLCSWLYLARYYTLDMPAYNIKYTRAPIADAYRVTGLKQFKQQDIEFQTNKKIDLNKAIKTSVGTGIIDSLSINIDTQLVSATLVYSPD